MRIYIDETGSFVPPNPPRDSFSLVLAHAVPSQIEKDLFDDFLRLLDTWGASPNIELKGNKLNESQAAQLIRLILRYDTVVHFVGMDMNIHPEPIITEFKKLQAEVVTANIGSIPHFRHAGEAVHKMSNQLFLQTFALWELLIETVREATLYFVQRLPSELGDIAWIIDRKDRTVTTMEEAWSTLILPVSEYNFSASHFFMLNGEDYSYFKARYGVTVTNDPEMRRHSEWMKQTCGIRVEAGEVVTDARRLFNEQLSFEDSRCSLGLQLTDMLASILRRALNNRLGSSGWEEFGRLLIANTRPGQSFIQLGSGSGGGLHGHSEMVCQILYKNAKHMFTEKNRRPPLAH